MQTVRDKAADLRRRLCDAVQEGQYSGHFKRFSLRALSGLLAHDLASVIVPEDIKRQIREKAMTTVACTIVCNISNYNRGCSDSRRKFSEN